MGKVNLKINNIPVSVEEGSTILLVEQNANMSLNIADRAYVLEHGKIIISGTGKELLKNPRVMEAYLGV